MAEHELSPFTKRARDGLSLRDSWFMRNLRLIWKHRFIYVLLLPGLLFFIIYVYWPMFGNIIAFQEFSPFRGFSGSPWVGLKQFERLFADPDLGRVIVNTFLLSGLQIMLAFPIPIVLALMLNEVRSEIYKRSIQSIIYLPHFISWVVIVGIWYQMFGSQGLINQLIISAGGETISFLTNPTWFRVNFVLQNVWKGSGWGTIIFLAALTSIPQELYEAAAIDGASRFQRMRHVTLPGIRPVILVVLIIQMGNVLNIGFEHIFLLLNPVTEPYAQVLDTFVYTRGIVRGDFSFATAVGLVKGVVGMIMVLTANWLARRFGDGGIL
jgi:putative aldouronate transport system permease protein